MQVVKGSRLHRGEALNHIVPVRMYLSDLNNTMADMSSHPLHFSIVQAPGATVQVEWMSV